MEPRPAREEPRQHFARLAVFAGTFTVEAAEAVCDVSLSALSELIEHSLLRRWASGRIGMLETIREYAVERFEALPEADELRRRHFEHMLELAERAKHELDAGASQEEWLGESTPSATVSGAHSAGCSRAERCRWPAIGLHIGEVLGGPRSRRGLSLARRRLPIPTTRRRRCERTRCALRGARSSSPGTARAAELAEEALGLFRELGDKREVARMLDRLAAAQVNLKRLDAARASAEESLALLEELGDREGTPYVLEKLGWIEWESDHRERGWS